MQTLNPVSSQIDLYASIYEKLAFDIWIGQVKSWVKNFYSIDNI